MTLSLVLSFMPVIAFADTEAEGSAAVSETVEAEQAEPIQDNVEAEATVDAAEPVEEATTEEEAAEEDSQQTVHAQALYAADDEEDSEVCEHKSTYTEEEVDYEHPVYKEIEGDNRYHTVSCKAYEVEYCDECGEEVSRKEIAPEEFEDIHHYDGLVCADCGHKNTCTHGETGTELYYNKDVVYTDNPADNKNHHVKGSGEEVTFCNLCSYELSKKPVQIDKDAEHLYDEDGVYCLDCGHKNTCTHKNTSTEEEREWGLAKYIEIEGNDEQHKVSGPVEFITTCDDCGIIVKVETKDIEEEEEHNFDEDGECVDCGHVYKCKHENTSLDEDVDWDNPKYEEVEGDNRYHKLIYPREEVEVCDDCEEEISRKAIAPLVEEDNHNYVDGVCVECGHKNTCTHDEMDTYTDWKDEDVDYTNDPNNNKNHHVTGSGVEVTVCKRCGYVESRKPVQIDEDEEHEYEKNEQGEQVCVDCGHKNTCTHKNTRTEEERDWELAKYTEIAGNDLCHKVTGPVEVVTYCNDCGQFVKSETVDKEEEEEHDYNSELVCGDCGHINKCKHAHTYESYNWDEDEVKCTSVNNKVHRVKGPGTLETWCEDCEAKIKSEKINIDKDFYHEYNSNHICTECGHTNTCKHPSTYFEYDYDSDECKIADNKDGKTHTVEGNIEKITWCKECEEKLKTEELGKTKVSEIHYYNRDNVCRYCGYHKPSAEDNARIFGQLRYDTAIAVAEKCKDSSGKFENVIVAYGRNFPDALSGGYLAKVKNAPILLVEPSVEGRIVEYISQNIASGGKVYILGGTGVVSSAFESKIKAKNVSTERLGGATRYDTNLAILKAAGVKAEDILVCTGTGYADSLSASAVGKPILLVGNTLTDDQKTYIKGLSSKQFYLIGGTGAVKPAVESDLIKLGFKPERLWGSTRYETSTAVAKKFFETAKTVILAYAQNFPDGLSGGPLAMLKNAPIVLTDSNTTAAAKAYVKSAGIVNSITLGGPALISDIAVKTIMGR